MHHHEPILRPGLDLMRLLACKDPAVVVAGLVQRT